VGLAAGLACAQVAPPVVPQPANAAGALTRAGRFSLEVSVTGADGLPLSDLKGSEFHLADQGSPARIFTVSAPGADTFQVVLVVDELNPGSRHIREAAEAFLRRDSGHLAYPVSVFLLNDTGLTLIAEGSRDGNALADQIAHPGTHPVRGIMNSYRTSRFTGADDRMIDPSFKEILSLNALGGVILRLREAPGRKLVVWMGGGWLPTRISIEHPLDFVTELSTRMRESRMVLDWIDDEQPAWDKRFLLDDFIKPARTDGDAVAERLALPVLAVQSGGANSSVWNVEESLARAVSQSAASYTLTFDPANTGTVDDFHSLGVTVDRPGTVVRTRAGYYDEPTYYDHPNTDVDRVTVAQLDALVHDARNRRDAVVLRALARMQLTERLSTPHLEELLPLLKDEQERQQLTAVADASAFLRLPAAEMPNDPAPSPDEQRAIIQSAFKYLKEAIPRLPDFFAERKTVFYEPRPVKTGVTWKTFTGDASLRPAAISTATVLYRDGKEVVSDEVDKNKHGYTHQRSLKTTGEFGVALSSILYGAVTGGTVGWDHWERGPDGLEAVFHLHVPVAGSRFATDYCCMPEDHGKAVFHRIGAYNGEFAVDPKTGAILRMAVSADFDLEREPDLPLMRSANAIEYAPVNIGGSAYICPVRSLSVTRGRTVRQIVEWGGSVFVYGPFEDMIDDMSFAGYHKFGSESRILSGVEEVPENQHAKPGASGPQ
jgi:VWFA-related protein